MTISVQWGNFDFTIIVCGLHCVPLVHTLVTSHHFGISLIALVTLWDVKEPTLFDRAGMEFSHVVVFPL